MKDIDIALEAARAGAAIVREALGRPADPSFKTSAVDPVTVTDHASDAAILEVIRAHRPDDATLTEESGGAGWDGPRVWIADPLDGTVNFVHGLPHVAVSVAVWDLGRPLAGAVVDVAHGDEFSAAAGEGAFLNGEPIHVAGESEISRALAVTGFPYDRQKNADRYAEVLRRVLTNVQGVRRTGSSALDVCYVACGRMDIYWEYGLGAWDAAASLLILSEAGGVYTAFGGGDYRLGHGGVIATNEHLIGRMQEIVGDGGVR